MKRISSILFSVLSVVLISSGAAAQVDILPNPANDNEPVVKDCISQVDMADMARHFRQFSNLAGKEFCNDDSATWHLLSSLMFMRQTKFSDTMNPSEDELFSGKFAHGWYDYFIGRINELEIVGNCPKGVIAYVYMWGNTMYTCPMALTNNFSSLDRASVMMHEARHIDGFPHITCSKGARKGLQGACDDRISKGGSYAVTVETYAQLAQFAEGIHPAMKAYAKSSAIVYADEAFEVPVRIHRNEKLLTLTNTLDFHSLDVQTNETTQLGKAPAAGHIVRRGQHMILMPTDKSLKAGYVFSNNEGELTQSPSDLVTEYNNQTPDQKANLVDLHIAAQWSARVYKNSVKFLCDPRATTENTIALPAGLTAAALVFPDGYARDKYTVQLTTASGAMLEIGCDNKRAFVRQSAVKLDQPYARVHRAGGKIFGLTAAGELFSLEGERSTPVATALQGSIIEIVPQESFRFFE